MESNLHDRDRVGVQDAVLLENYTSEVAFVDNIHKRFKEDIIYVSKFNKKFQFCAVLKHILNFRPTLVQY